MDNAADLLRQHVAKLARTDEQEITAVLDAFRAEVLKLIEAVDAQFLARAVPLSDAGDRGK